MSTATQGPFSINIAPSGGLPLISFADMQYQGAFRVPTGQQGDSIFRYGSQNNQVATYNPTNDSLFMVGHDWHQSIAEISIPAPVMSGNGDDLNVASMLQNFVDMQSRIPNWTLGPDPAKIGGLVVAGGKLIGNYYEYYDADSDGQDSHWVLDGLNLSDDPVSGLYQVGDYGGDGGGLVGGGMTPIPVEWQSSLGMPYATGSNGYAIVGRTSLGPCAIGFNPDDLGVVNPAPAIDYVRYTITNDTLGAWDDNSPPELWNGSCHAKCFMFIPGTRSVMWIGDKGVGDFCYGTAEECNDTSKTSGKGVHTPGGVYAYCAYTYDVNTLIAVKNGQMNYWEPIPQLETFSLPFSPSSGWNRLGGACIDPIGNRIFIIQQNSSAYSQSDYPLIHVYTFP